MASSRDSSTSKADKRTERAVEATAHRLAVEMTADQEGRKVGGKPRPADEQIGHWILENAKAALQSQICQFSPSSTDLPGDSAWRLTPPAGVAPIAANSSSL